IFMLIRIVSRFQRERVRLPAEQFVEIGIDRNAWTVFSDDGMARKRQGNISVSVDPLCIAVGVAVRPYHRASRVDRHLFMVDIIEAFDLRKAVSGPPFPHHLRIVSPRFCIKYRKSYLIQRVQIGSDSQTKFYLLVFSSRDIT